MNWDRVAGICRQFKGRMGERWASVSGNPRIASAGTRDRLAGEAQVRRGIVRETSERELSEFYARNRDWRNLSR